MTSITPLTVVSCGSTSKNPYSWFYVSIQEATHAHDHEMKGDVEAWIEIHAPNVSNK